MMGSCVPRALAPSLAHTAAAVKIKSARCCCYGTHTPRETNCIFGGGADENNVSGYAARAASRRFHSNFKILIPKLYAMSLCWRATLWLQSLRIKWQAPPLIVQIMKIERVSLALSPPLCFYKLSSARANPHSFLGLLNDFKNVFGCSSHYTFDLVTFTSAQLFQKIIKHTLYF
jgi:hypothetical protein